VVVGGLVVVDVGLLVAGAGDTPETLGAGAVAVAGAVAAAGAGAGAGAGATVVGVVLEVVAAAGPGSGGFVEGADAPGCSFATATPMQAVAPPAITIAVRVSRVIRVCTLARSPGAAWAGPRFMAVLRVATQAPARDRPSGPRCAPAYGPTSPGCINLEVEPHGRISAFRVTGRRRTHHLLQVVNRTWRGARPDLVSALFAAGAHR
jgi:hypothetical protein